VVGAWGAVTHCFWLGADRNTKKKPVLTPVHSGAMGGGKGAAEIRDAHLLRLEEYTFIRKGGGLGVLRAQKKRK